jgi:hypothetical protein
MLKVLIPEFVRVTVIGPLVVPTFWPEKVIELGERAVAPAFRNTLIEGTDPFAVTMSG